MTREQNNTKLIRISDMKCKDRQHSDITREFL